MEVKTEGMKAVITILVNVSQFMSSLGTLLGSGDFNKLDKQEQDEIINNTKSISSFLNEFSLSLHDMIVKAEGSEDEIKK
ncbi:MAG TPA: hypothetical protein HPP56_04680 [Nitrospirae bacterium]|nr:hypothetical protein [Nitrospirota bacterium]